MKIIRTNDFCMKIIPANDICIKIIRINFLEKIDLRFQDRVILTPCVPQNDSQRI
jgi:hypothetical protein